jgi:hypothetical protein
MRRRRDSTAPVRPCAVSRPRTTIRRRPTTRRRTRVRSRPLRNRRGPSRTTSPAHPVPRRRRARTGGCAVTASTAVARRRHPRRARRAGSRTEPHYRERPTNLMLRSPARPYVSGGCRSSRCGSRAPGRSARTPWPARR